MRTPLDEISEAEALSKAKRTDCINWTTAPVKIKITIGVLGKFQALVFTEFDSLFVVIKAKNCRQLVKSPFFVLVLLGCRIATVSFPDGSNSGLTHVVEVDLCNAGCEIGNTRRINDVEEPCVEALRDRVWPLRIESTLILPCIPGSSKQFQGDLNPG